jgi:hypothetical protein
MIGVPTKTLPRNKVKVNAVVFLPEKNAGKPLAGWKAS